MSTGRVYQKAPVVTVIDASRAIQRTFCRVMKALLSFRTALAFLKAFRLGPGGSFTAGEGQRAYQQPFCHAMAHSPDSANAPQISS